MDRTMDWIRGHKAVFFGLVASLMVVMALVSALVSAPGAPAPEEAPAAEEAKTEPVEEPRPAPAAESASVDALRDAYGAEQDRIEEILEGCAWGGGDRRGRASFEDGVLTETLPSAVGSEEASTSYAIGEVSSSQVPTAVPDGTTVESFVIYDADGVAHAAHLVTYLEQAGTAEEPSAFQAYRLSSDIFEHQGYYTNAGVAEGLEVTGLSDEAVEALGGDERAIEEALRGYELAHDTTVHECAWDETLSYDFAAGTVEAGFRPISNSHAQPSATVVLTYAVEGGTLQVGERNE